MHVHRQTQTGMEGKTLVSLSEGTWSDSSFFNALVYNKIDLKLVVEKEPTGLPEQATHGSGQENLEQICSGHKSLTGKETQKIRAM